MNPTWPTWFSPEGDLTNQTPSCIVKDSMNEVPSVPYPVTVVNNDGEPVGMVTPDGQFNTNAPSKVGQRGVDEDEGMEFEVVWDGACRQSLLGVPNGRK
jgi:hypothetical protein